ARETAAASRIISRAARRGAPGPGPAPDPIHLALASAQPMPMSRVSRQRPIVHAIVTRSDRRIAAVKEIAKLGNAPSPGALQGVGRTMGRLVTPGFLALPSGRFGAQQGF